MSRGSVRLLRKSGCSSTDSRREIQGPLETHVGVEEVAGV